MSLQINQLDKLRSPTAAKQLSSKGRGWGDGRANSFSTEKLICEGEIMQTTEKSSFPLSPCLL
ncbi:hypothetical protein, partial [[Phormidium] sp. LEGE 05292]|uniref:hypothetical protein n=1 Tax=[Phormidium] sp. LEGE 05292 TaxID=767427 RepID=UPI001D142887